MSRFSIPDCRLGGPCDLITREGAYGMNARDGVGVAQCTRCSIVYEAIGFQRRVCPECHLEWGESLHDPCLEQADGTREIPGAVAACCGHGGRLPRYGVPDDWPMRVV